MCTLVIPHLFRVGIINKAHITKLHQEHSTLFFCDTISEQIKSYYNIVVG